MWKKLAEIPESAWTDALDMPGAQVAETAYRPEGWKHEPLRLIVRRVPFTASEIAKRKGSRRLKTIHPAQLQLALEGKAASVYGYSFILSDLHWQPAVWIEHFHRHRAQIEERLKEAKLGQALRHLPSGNEHANRVWLAAALLALNLTAFCCDLWPAAGASGKAPEDAPLRRAAKTLRRCCSTCPPASRAVAGARSCTCHRASVTPASSRPRSTRSTRCRPDPTKLPAADIDRPQHRPARRPRERARSAPPPRLTPPRANQHLLDHAPAIIRQSNQPPTRPPQRYSLI